MTVKNRRLPSEFWLLRGTLSMVTAYNKVYIDWRGKRGMIVELNRQLVGSWAPHLGDARPCALARIPSERVLLLNPKNEANRFPDLSSFQKQSRARFSSRPPRVNQELTIMFLAISIQRTRHFLLRRRKCLARTSTGQGNKKTIHSNLLLYVLC